MFSRFPSKSRVTAQNRLGGHLAQDQAAERFTVHPFTLPFFVSINSSEYQQTGCQEINESPSGEAALKTERGRSGRENVFTVLTCKLVLLGLIHGPEAVVVGKHLKRKHQVQERFQREWILNTVSIQSSRATMEILYLKNE